MHLQDKRIVITGAGRGLGMAVTHELVTHGAKVVGVDKHFPTEYPGAGQIVADLRGAQAMSHVANEAMCLLGSIDVLINNAGVLSLQDAGDTTNQDVVDAVEVNLLAPWRLTAELIHHLRESRGRVINISSLFAVVNAPFIPAYAATKRGLSAFSDILRMQYGDRITVTTLYPGYLATHIHDVAIKQGLLVEAIVSLKQGDRKLLSFEESLDKAAKGVVRACVGRPIRDAGLTQMGTMTLWLARHFPSLVDHIVAWRLSELTRDGMQIHLTPDAT